MAVRAFIDYLRNQRGSTAVLPYVAWARPGAPVAAPVSWSELREAGTLIERATSRALKGWGQARQVLPDL